MLGFVLPVASAIFGLYDAVGRFSRMIVLVGALALLLRAMRHELEDWR
jgi:hypothetical protein